ncbi:LOW QUALITY PROTEIN: hypothetical protein Nmel_013317 [Mimus melanotis]
MSTADTTPSGSKESRHILDNTGWTGRGNGAAIRPWELSPWPGLAMPTQCHGAVHGHHQWVQQPHVRRAQCQCSALLKALWSPGNVLSALEISRCPSKPPLSGKWVGQQLRLAPGECRAQPSPADKVPPIELGVQGLDVPGVGTIPRSQLAPEASHRSCPSSSAAGAAAANRLCAAAKMFAGAEARINILFNQGLGVNTVYPGSLRREQLQGRARDTDGRWQSDLRWHGPSPGCSASGCSGSSRNSAPGQPCPSTLLWREQSPGCFQGSVCCNCALQGLVRPGPAAAVPEPRGAGRALSCPARGSEVRVLPFIPVWGRVPPVPLLRESKVRSELFLCKPRASSTGTQHPLMDPRPAVRKRADGNAELRIPLWWLKKSFGGRCEGSPDCGIANQRTPLLPASLGPAAKLFRVFPGN